MAGVVEYRVLKGQPGVCPFLSLKRVERICSLNSIRSWRYSIVTYLSEKSVPYV